jgi:putative chitinase
VIDREIFFAKVRDSLFGGSLAQSQVDGLNSLLDYFEVFFLEAGRDDLRWLAYMLATSHHETGQTHQPIEEWGKGEGHDYGVEDPETGQTYYGRGYVQLTWRDNYCRATQNLKLAGGDDLEWHAARALDPVIAAQVMGDGMMAGWFTGKSLPQYFNETTDDPVGARLIINPDDKGELIAGYYADFLEALEAATAELTPPSPKPIEIKITIDSPVPVKVTVL